MRKSIVPFNNKNTVKFCQFMQYNLLKQDAEGYYFFEIPSNHICRFFVNFTAWQEGTFNKEKFLESFYEPLP